MKNRVSTNLRKWISLILAVLIYYVIHEGSHVLAALSCGVFEAVKFLGAGVQVVINDTLLSHLQLAVFCVVGSIASLAAGYILTALTGRIVRVGSKYFKAVGFYTTLVMLLLDPLYLSVLYRFFGGGDMNGIVLFGLPEVLIQAIYGAVGVLNLFLFIKVVLPKYKAAFAQ